MSENMNLEEKYNYAIDLLDKHINEYLYNYNSLQELKESYEIFSELRNYKDSDKRAKEAENRIVLMNSDYKRINNKKKNSTALYLLLTIFAVIILCSFKSKILFSLSFLIIFVMSYKIFKTWFTDENNNLSLKIKFFFCELPHPYLLIVAIIWRDNLEVIAFLMVLLVALFSLNHFVTINDYCSDIKDDLKFINQNLFFGFFQAFLIIAMIWHSNYIVLPVSLVLSVVISIVYYIKFNELYNAYWIVATAIYILAIVLCFLSNMALLGMIIISVPVIIFFGMCILSKLVE